MSLILSSDRNSTSKIIRNKSSILTPSSNFLNISENIQQNRAPFNTKMEKYFEFSEKRNNVLGPGAYYHPQQRSFLKKSFSKNPLSIEEMNKNELYNLALFKVVNKKKSIKLNAQKSLVIDKQNRNQVFNINNVHSLNDFNKSSSLDENKANIMLIPTTLTKNRINSIPSKDHFLGYEFDDNGLPIIVDSSVLFISNNKKNNDENDKNILIEKNKKINAVDWSKMSKKEISLENNNYNYNNENTTKENSTNIYNSLNEDINDITSSLTNTNISNINNINSSKKKFTRNKSESLSFITNNELNTEKNISTKNFSSFSKVQSSNKKFGMRYRSPEIHLFTKKKKSLEDFVYDNLFKGEPGPGYYQSQSNFDKYNIIKNKNQKVKYNFGSNAIRSDYLLNPDNNINLGPGCYFKEKYERKIKTGFFPLSRKEEGINIKKYEKDFDNENMGPGKYEFKSQFDKTQLYYNGPLEKRFFDNFKKIDVGPGAYLPLYDWNKYREKEENKKKDLKKDEKKENQEKKENDGRDSYILKNENPGAGTYNPHIVNSIHYDIISKENKLSNLRMPFNSGQERFMKKSTSSHDMLGPGRYFDRNKSIGNVVLKADKTKGLYRNSGLNNDDIKDIYKNEKVALERKVGPGSYDLHNYYEWHKKNFNAIYV